MSCPAYEFKSGIFGGDYYCNYKRDDVPSSWYSRYCKGYYYDECPTYQAHNSSSCFITTVVHKILGKGDNDPILDKLRKFRNDVLQSNDKYKEVLATYDVVGPAISCRLYHEPEPNRKQIATNLFNLGISNVCKLLDENKEEEAIKLYTDMTTLLMQGYGITESVDQEYLDHMDISKSGHGRRALKREYNK